MNRRVSLVVVLVIVAVCLLALYRLLVLQFERGDAYPQYSSYRADPLGLLVFYEAVAAAGHTPQRNLTPLDSATFPENSTILLAGAAISEDEVSTLERLEAFVAAGGRLVVLFRADQSDVAHRAAAEKKEDEGEDEKDPEEENTPDRKTAGERAEEMMRTLVPRADISERWGFAYAARSIEENDNEERIAEVQRGAAASTQLLPARIMWHSEMVFEDIAPEWTVVYERDADPVVLERQWGEGSIVVASDNYLVSNEAMRVDRAAGYLAWIAGTQRTLIFEETHLGVARSTGVMTLARRYGLIPVLLAGVFLALLLIWKNAVPLVPRHAARSGHETAALHSTVTGLASLVRRAVRRADLLDTAWRLHQAPALHRPPIDATGRTFVESALESYRTVPARRRDPVAVFNEINARINERKRKS